MITFDFYIFLNLIYLIYKGFDIMTEPDVKFKLKKIDLLFLMSTLILVVVMIAAEFSEMI